MAVTLTLAAKDDMHTLAEGLMLLLALKSQDQDYSMLII
jgi:hypothetical protein